VLWRVDAFFPEAFLVAGLTALAGASFVVDLTGAFRVETLFVGVLAAFFGARLGADFFATLVVLFGLAATFLWGLVTPGTKVAGFLVCRLGLFEAAVDDRAGILIEE